MKTHQQQVKHVVPASEETVENRVLALVAKEFGLPIADVTLESKLHVLAPSELDLLELTITLEDEFNIDIDDDEFDALDDLAALRDYVTKLLDPETVEAVPAFVIGHLYSDE